MFVASDGKKYVAGHPTMVVALLGLLINTIILINYSKSPFSSFLLWDAANYWEWAMQIADGDQLKTVVFHQPPLYPYLIAVFIRFFGKTLLPIYFFQSVLSAMTAAMVCSIGRTITASKKTGFVSGLLYVFYGMQAFYTVKILPECVAAFLLTLTVFLLLSKTAGVRTVAAGVAMGSVLLVKPHFLMAVPLLSAGYFIRRPACSWKYSLRQAALFVVVVGAVMSVATIRNVMVAHERVLISGNAGENFYIGNNEHANGTYVPVRGVSSDIAFQNEDVIAYAQESTGGELSRAAVSQFWFKKATDWILRHPADYVRLEITKLLNMFSGAELSNMYLLSFEKKNLTPAFNLAWVNFYLLFPFFTIGLMEVRVFWRRCFPAAVLLLANMAGMLLFFYDERFRVITMPFFILVSGFGTVNFSKVVKAGVSVKKLLAALTVIMLVVSLGILGAQYTRDRKFPNREWRMMMALGDISYGKGDIDSSLDYYIKASELNKTDCMPAFMVSKVMFRKGYRDIAAELYRSTMRTVNTDERTTILRDRDFDLLREFLKMDVGKRRN